MEPPQLNLAPAPDPLDPGLWSENPEPDSTSRDAAEKAVLGSLLVRPHLLADLTLNPADYTQARHETIHRAIQAVAATGATPDTITVSDHLTQTGDLRRAGGHIYLLELLNYAAPYNLRAHAEIVTRAAARRRLTLAFQTAAQQAENGAPLHQVLHQLNDATAATTPPTSPTAGQTIDAFLHGEDDPYDWLIPGVLERQDRLILTAAEGKGKSTLLRQIGVQAASGIHPFTLETITPIKVLYLDLENSARQSRRKLRPLRIQAGERLDPENFIIEVRPQGLDLTSPDDRAWLAALISEHAPDLLITGPIYKMASGDVEKEKDSKPVALAIDALRNTHDMAVVLEAHTRKAEGANPTKRAKEPYGWSGWMRWPEFGLHLAEDGQVTHWRGSRDEREFPSLLSRGGAWPWNASTNLTDQRWIAIKNAIRDAGRKLTQREMADAIGVNVSRVNEIVRDRSFELAQLYYSLDQEGGQP